MSSDRTISFTEIASGFDWPEGPVALPDGSVLVVEAIGRRLVRVAAGRKHLVAELAGGPNGAAIGPDGRCYICNNGGLSRTETGWLKASDDYNGGWIEAVDLRTGKTERIYDAGPFGRLSAPNDLVFDRAGGFWFTDTGKSHARSTDNGGVYYAQPDGSSITEVIYPISKPNGVALSPDENALYVSETMSARLWKFELAGPGKIRRQPTLTGGSLLLGLPGMSGFDSMAVDGDGNVCVATIFSGGITVVSSDGSWSRFLDFADPLTTNICFGGKDFKTAYVTLSGKGLLVSAAWETSGHPLNFRQAS